MITNEQIEEAQESIFEDKFLNNEVDTLHYDNGDSDPVYTGGQIKEAIELGAHWAIKELLKGLWHDANEEPKEGAIILIEYDYDGLTFYISDNYRSNKDWANFLEKVGITRWLYIEDLLPKKGGEE